MHTSAWILFLAVLAFEEMKLFAVLLGCSSVASALHWTQLLFYKTIYRSLDVRRIIQRYGNIANQRGEYSSDAMIMCHPNGPVQCMPLPIVAHQRNHYQVYDVSVVKHIKQIGVDSKNF